MASCESKETRQTDGVPDTVSSAHLIWRKKTWKDERQYLLALEVWDTEKHLHDRVEVATVAQIFHASQARAKQRLQGGAGLLDHLPLPHTLVDGDLQLGHRPLGLAAENISGVRAAQFIVSQSQLPQGDS